MKKTVVLGITSGIAAFKAIDLVKLLKAEDINVIAILTEKATHMIPMEELEQVTQNKVYTSLFEADFDYKTILETRSVDHIQIADKADLFVIVPATANILAKAAHGMADDFLTTTLLATTAPVIFCPAMNVHMWSNPIVQNNINILKNHGDEFIMPTKGMLACGYEGIGRLEDIHLIKERIFERLHKNDFLKGKKILVTAGGTQEPIDAVRFMTNKSSGKMGIALAEECTQQGADVLLLRAENAVEPRFSIPTYTFKTADELSTLISKHVKDYDVIFHTAAVSDFQVTKPSTKKLDSKTGLTLELTPRIKILDQIKKWNPVIKLIAFKAETHLTEEELIQKAQQRLKESHADVIIANDVGKSDRGFSSNNNEVTVIQKNGSVKKLSLDSKKNIARKIIDIVLG